MGVGISSMWNTWFIKTEPIGCDISAGHLRLAQLQGMAAQDGTASAPPRLVVAERELPQLAEEDPAYGRAVSGLLRDMLRTAQFRGTRIVSCPSARAVQYRTMRLAPMPPDELPQAAHWKVAAELSLKPDDLKSAVLIAGTIREGSKPKTEALVVAAPVAELDRHLVLLQRAALNPVAIDLSVCAVARCLGTPGLWSAEPPAARIVLDLRQDGAMLAIVVGTELAFARPVGDGLAQLDQILADLLDVSPARAHELYGQSIGSDPAPASPLEPAVTLPDVELAPGLSRSRVQEAIADASRMVGRELARQVALSVHHYATTFQAAPPDVGTLVSDRPLDSAALEAVTVQSGIDFAPLPPAAPAIADALAAACPGAELGAWTTALGLSLYEHGLAGSREVA